MIQRTQSDAITNIAYGGTPLPPSQSLGNTEENLQSCSRPPVEADNLAEFITSSKDAQDANAGLEATVLPTVLKQLILSYIASGNGMRYAVQVFNPQCLWDHCVDESVGQTSVEGWLHMLQELKRLGTVQKLPCSITVVYLCSDGLDHAQLDPIFAEGNYILSNIARRFKAIFSDFGLPPCSEALLYFSKRASDKAESKQPSGVHVGCPLGDRTKARDTANASVVDVPDEFITHLHPAVRALVLAYRANSEKEPSEKKQCLQSVSSGEHAVQERSVVCKI